MFTHPGSATVETSLTTPSILFTMAAASGKDSAKEYVKFTGEPSPKFFWWDTRTDKERNRKRKTVPDPRNALETGRKNPLCKAVRCPRFGRRGWFGGFCRQCAPKNGRTKPVAVQGQCKKGVAKIADKDTSIAKQKGGEGAGARGEEENTNDDPDEANPQVKLQKCQNERPQQQHLVEEQEKPRRQRVETRGDEGYINLYIILMDHAYILITHERFIIVFLQNV
jgi:hypothetical protein